MLKKFLFITTALFFSVGVIAQYNGPRYLSVDLSTSGSALITIEQDLQDELNEAAGNDQFLRYAPCISSAECPNWLSSAWTEVEGASELTIVGPGLYKVVAYENNIVFDDIIWEQLVYIPYPPPSESAVELAKQYLPVVIFNEEEEYFPQSLEEILSYGSGDGETVVISRHRAGDNEEPLSMGEKLKAFMSFNGHMESWLNFGFRETTCSTVNNGCSPLFLRGSTGDSAGSTIYWDASTEGDELFLTYYFFYAFDPKTGSMENPAEGAHAFDRESFTIRFAVEGDAYTPLDATYAGHLPEQSIEFNGCKNLGGNDCSQPAEFPGGNNKEFLEIENGKTSISWEFVNRIGNHPVIYKAKGSHAIFPALGWYTVQGADFVDILREPAGSIASGSILFPSTARLAQLDLNSLSYLAFSGFWVDVLGSSDARFPPFIRVPYKTWLSDTSRSFNNCLDGTLDSQNCAEVREYFVERSDYGGEVVYDKSNLKGLGDFRAITASVFDSSEPGSPPLPDVKVRLEASDGSLSLVEMTRLGGRYTFFLKPKENVLYQVTANENVVCASSNAGEQNLYFLSEDFEEVLVDCDIGSSEPFDPDRAQYLTFQEGNPGTPGDGITISSGTGVADYMFTTPKPFGGSSGIGSTSTFFFQPPNGTGWRVQGVFLTNNSCVADTSSSPVQPGHLLVEVNGVTGYAINSTPDVLDAYLDLIRATCGAAVSPDDIEFVGINVKTFDSSATIPLDAFAFGYGPNNLPEGVVPSTGDGEDTITVNGREWYQPDLFTNLTWNDINAVCPLPAGVCSGELNGYDLTGWTWATAEDAVSLFNSYGVIPPLGASEIRIQDDHLSSWAPLMFDAGWRSTAADACSIANGRSILARVASPSVQSVSNSSLYYSKVLQLIDYQTDVKCFFEASDEVRIVEQYPIAISGLPLGALFYRANEAPITDTVVVNGKEWYQPDLFTNLSWNDINAVCPGGVCNGTLNGYDVTGWTWASSQDMSQLFNYYIGPPNPVGPFLPYQETCSAWAPEFFAAGWRETVTIESFIATMGWSSTLNPGQPDYAYLPALTDSILCADTDSADAGGLLSVGRGSSTRFDGAWFFR